MTHLASILSLTILSSIGGVAVADSSPKGPDFSAAPPTHHMDASLAASDGTRPIMPSDVIAFRKDSDAISPGALSQITQTAKWMSGHKDQRLIIEGHTDRLGGKAINEDLATRRADAVRSQLILRGVKSDRIVLEIFGEQGSKGPANELERAVVLSTSLAGIPDVVTDALEQRGALTVTWTDKGALLTESAAEHALKAGKKIGTR